MRILIRDTRWLAITLIVLVMAMRALVPQGFMLAPQGQVLTVQVCADAAGLPHLRQISLAGKAPSAPQDSGHAQHAVCAFAGHAMPMLGGADPLLLQASLAVVLAMALAPCVPTFRRHAARLRPPLRAPPFIA